MKAGLPVLSVSESTSQTGLEIAMPQGPNGMSEGLRLIAGLNFGARVGISAGWITVNVAVPEMVRSSVNDAVSVAVSILPLRGDLLRELPAIWIKFSNSSASIGSRVMFPAGHCLSRSAGT